MKAVFQTGTAPVATGSWKIPPRGLFSLTLLYRLINWRLPFSLSRHLNLSHQPCFVPNCYTTQKIPIDSIFFHFAHYKSCFLVCLSSKINSRMKLIIYNKKLYIKQANGRSRDPWRFFLTSVKSYYSAKYTNSLVSHQHKQATHFQSHLVMVCHAVSHFRKI